MNVDKFSQLMAIHDLIEEANLAVIEASVSIALLDHGLKRYRRAVTRTEKSAQFATRIGHLRQFENARSLFEVELLRERKNKKMLLKELAKIAQGPMP